MSFCFVGLENEG